MSDSSTLVAAYGDIEDFPATASHDDGARPCIHLLGRMPRIILVSAAPVLALNFQPRICSTFGPHPIIAARTGSVLTLSVDIIGPIRTTHPNRGRRIRDHRIFHHWRFVLNEIADDPQRLLAVRDPDAADAGDS